MKTLRILSAALLFVFLCTYLSPPMPAAAVGGYVQRIEMWQGGSMELIYNGGWVNQTVNVDVGGVAVEIRIFRGGGTPTWDYYLWNNDGYSDSTPSSSDVESFWPWPPYEATYRAYVDGSTPGSFYLVGEYPDLIASTPRPNDGAASDPFCVGETIDWYVTVTNQGDGTAGSSDLQYYLGTSSGDLSNEINHEGVSSLSPGDDDDVHDDYIFVGGDTGTRYLNVEADADDELDEEIESNNTNSYGPFQVLDIPSPVSLSSPADGSGTCSGTPMFTWTSMPAATEYLIHIDNNADFSSPERAATVGAGTTFYVPNPALTPNRWYWRVRATNTCGPGSWSTPRTLDVLTTPGQPGLISPLQGESTCDATPEFTWSAVSGASGYRFQLDDETSFSTPVIEQYQAGLSYIPGSGISPETYYWRVRAENACGIGSYTAYRTIVISGPPATPSMTSPSDGVSQCSLLPTFNWSSVTDATGYLIQVDNDPAFGSPVIDESTLGLTYTPGSALSPDQYYWRVAAQGTCGNSPWSGGWSLELLDIPPSPSLQFPAADAEICTLSPSFSWLASFQGDEYRFMLDDDVDYSSPVLEELVGTTSYDASSLSSGSYFWRVRGENQCGNGSWSIPNRQVTLHNPTVIADFTAFPLTGNLPLTVNFNNASTGDIDSGVWDFGDTGSSTDTNPDHMYLTEGLFDVSLSVSGFCGTDDEVKSNLINVTDIPPVISEIQETNVRDTSFTISWITDLVSGGYIEFGTTGGLGQTADDTRGVSHSGTTHYTQLMGLEPETTYYYDVISGSTRDDNGGLHYLLTTGPTLSIPSPDTAYGHVFKTGGITPAEGTIAYLTLVDNDGSGTMVQSAEMSSLVDASGYWFFNLGNARLNDHSGYFVYSLSGDNLDIFAQGGADGIGCLVEDTASDAPASDVLLGSGCPSQYKIFLPLITR